MESVPNSPYKPHYDKPHYDKQPQQPSIPAGPSSYPNEIPQNTPMIPSYDYATANQKKLVDLQVYEQKKPNLLAEKQANIALQPLALSSPFMPPQFQSYFNNMMKEFYTPFIYKDYNISIGGPNADRMHATVLYEDILPPNDVYTSYKSMRERNNLAEYIRSTFINIEEGESKNFKGDGPNSINSRLKLIELTPNNPSYYTLNPYSASAKNFLLYTSCYPIIYDRKDHGSQCSKSSTGINLRVYEIHTGEVFYLFPNKASKFFTTAFQGPSITSSFILKTSPPPDNYLNQIIEYYTVNQNNLIYNYDSIRDLKYYNYIRDTICKQKISPNFIQPYCYFLDETTKITFNKNGTTSSSSSSSLSEEQQEKQKIENSINMQLLILTESPTQSIKYWCSNNYVNDRNTRRQTSIGYKSEKIWDSIIAQILLSFYVMLKYKFVINEMSLENNFFIKEINIFGQPNQYWIYTINNINYYVPNHGFLLMLDHNYKDLDPNTKPQHKILSKNLFNDKDIDKHIYDNIKKCTDVSIFKDNVIIPDNSKLIFSGINTEIGIINRDDFNINEYENILQKYLGKFMHNRIGTYIRDLEYNYINKDDVRPFYIGEIALYEESYDKYKFVLFLKTKDTTTYECISTNSNGNKENVDVDKNLLYHYTSTEEIHQDIKHGDSSLTIENLIERYII